MIINPLTRQLIPTKIQRNSTTLVDEIKKSRSLKSLKEVFASRDWTATNPKTIRRIKRALKKKTESLRLKTPIASYLIPV